MIGRYRTIAWVCVFATVITVGCSQSLTWLGTFAYDEASRAYGVSADGSVVVGASRTAGGQNIAFRWTRRGMENIAPPLTFNSVAYGVSANGSVAVGDASERAFYWTRATNARYLDARVSTAYSVSADGSVIVGFFTDSRGNRRACRWVRGREELELRGLESIARGVSADGSVIVGSRTTLSGQKIAFRWTAAGSVDLGDLGGLQSEAYGVSANGLVVVGMSYDADGRIRAFRWTQATGMRDLGGGEALAVSEDGSIVVGGTVDGNAFRWTQATGMQNLNRVYARLLSDGSRLTVARAISPNGRYIVGWGYNAQTMREEAFLLDTVPEPASLAALGMGLASLLGLRRRTR